MKVTATATATFRQPLELDQVTSRQPGDHHAQGILTVGLSIRSLARLIGVSHMAVLKPIGAGTLTPLPERTVDARAGAREWDLNTRNGRMPSGGPGVAGTGPGESLEAMRKARRALKVRRNWSNSPVLERNRLLTTAWHAVISSKPNWRARK